MDPVGPWSAYAAASYNRLATATGVTGANDYHRQLAAVGVAPGVPHMAASGGTATTSHQLLLQAAHASAASAVSSPSAFNPGRFLSPPPVGYDAVFSPLFHQKNTYNAALNQRHPALKQTGNVGESNVGPAPDIVTQYGAMHHHQTLAAAANVLFEHQTATSSPSSSSTSSVPPYQSSVAHAQLHSPFGILPHESVLTSGGTNSSKADSTPAFENTFNPHFSSSQLMNQSQNSNASNSSEFCQDNSSKKLNKSQNSPSSKTVSLMSQPAQSVVKSIVSSQLYPPGLHGQQSLPLPVSAKYSCKCGLNCNNLQCCLGQQQQHQRMAASIVTTTANSNTMTTSSNNSVIINNYQNANKSCLQLNNVIVNKNNNGNSNDGSNVSKKQVNIMSSDRRQAASDSMQKEQCSSGQSSPVCFAMTPLPPVHRTVADYGNNNNNNNNTNILVKGSPRNIITSQYNTPLRSVVSPVSYCQNMTSVKTPPLEMLKTAGVSGTQKSPDCGVVVPRRPSPLQAHSQSSPLAHVPSPGYPMYNSPVTSINSPTQQTSHSSSVAQQCQPHNYNNSKQAVPVGGEGNVTPLDVSVQRRSICEPLNKNYMTSSDCNIRQQSNSVARTWESSSLDRDRLNNNCQKMSNVVNTPMYETMVGQQRHIEQQQQQQLYYSYRGNDRTVSVVKQSSCDEKGSPEPCLPPSLTTNQTSSVKHKRNYEKNNVSQRDLLNLNVPSSSSSASSTSTTSSQSPLANRVPPPAHNNSTNTNQQQNDSYLDYERWNPSGSVKLGNVNSLSESFIENNKHIMSGIYNSNHFISSVAHQTNQSLNMPSSTYHPRLSNPLGLSNSFYHNPHPHPSGLHVSLMNPYSHSNSVSPSNDLQNAPVELAAPVAVTTGDSLADGNTPDKGAVEENPKVIVPNIEEELDFLVDSTPVAAAAFGQKQNMAATSEKIAPPTTKPSSGGFMASYIKFLQGERDSSPPPLGRNNRRAPLTRVKPVTTIPLAATEGTTTVTSTSAATTTTNSSQSQPSHPPPPVYNPEDDPRYFPLPKTSAHRRSLDSSDDDDDDNGEFSYFKNLAKKSETVNKVESSSSTLSSVKSNAKSEAVAKPVSATSNKSVANSTKKPTAVKTKNKAKVAEKSKQYNNDVKNPKKKNRKETISNKAVEKSCKKVVKSRKKRQPAPKHRRADDDSGEGNKKINKKESETEQEINEESVKDEVDPVPQRKVPKRKAKENINNKKLLEDDDEYENFDNDEEDEDFEPDWNPVDDDDDFEHGKGRRRRSRLTTTRSSLGKRRSLSRNLSRSSRSKRLKSNTENEEEDDEESQPSPKLLPKPLPTSNKTINIAEQKIKKEDNNVQATAVIENKNSENKTQSAVNGSSDKFKLPFNVGDFVVFISDMMEEWPPLWRVHSKSLLQKFESYDCNGETLYKSMPTFSGCTNKVAHTLKVVPCRVRSHTRGEFIVEFLRSDFILSPEEQSIVDEALKETLKYQDQFEVYIQTLLSQGLDSNFLAEIIHEKDEYFLVNVKAIDEVTEKYRSRLIEIAGWEKRTIERSLSTWPCYNVLYNLIGPDKDKKCESCDLADATSRVIAYGQPYNCETLEGRSPDAAILNHKEMLVCRNCLNAVALFNKIVHQKYLMFVECAKRVSEKRAAGPDKDTTLVLNELLADETWLSQLFKRVRLTWAEVNRFEFNNKNRKSTSVS